MGRKIVLYLLWVSALFSCNPFIEEAIPKFSAKKNPNVLVAQDSFDKLSSVNGMKLDSSDNIYLLCTYRGQYGVHIFKSDGTLLETFIPADLNVSTVEKMDLHADKISLVERSGFGRNIKINQYSGSKELIQSVSYTNINWELTDFSFSDGVYLNFPYDDVSVPWWLKIIDFTGEVLNEIEVPYISVFDVTASTIYIPNYYGNFLIYDKSLNLLSEFHFGDYKRTNKGELVPYLYNLDTTSMAVFESNEENTRYCIKNRCFDINGKYIFNYDFPIDDSDSDGKIINIFTEYNSEGNLIYCSGSALYEFEN